VYERFILNKGEERKFMPSLISDNPSLDAVEYKRSLAELDAVERARLLEGNWEVSESGGMFEADWFDVIDSPPSNVKKVRYWDLAATAAAKGKNPDYTVGALIGIDDGRYYVYDIQRIRGTPGEVQNLVKRTAESDGPLVDIVMEQEPGSGGVNTIDHYARTVLVGYVFKGVRPTGNKVERARVASSASEMGNIKLLRGRWNKAFVDELVQFPKGTHDDQVDALSGAVNSLVSRKRKVRIIV
jgi:predicted phage terminase large subunit-like protein